MSVTSSRTHPKRGNSGDGHSAYRQTKRHQHSKKARTRAGLRRRIEKLWQLLHSQSSDPAVSVRRLTQYLDAVRELVRFE